MPQMALQHGPTVPRRAVEIVVFVAACAATVWSAVLVKESRRGPRPMPALMAIESSRVAKAAPAAASPGDLAQGPARAEPADAPPAAGESAGPAAMRWFDGRPIRPAHVVWMTVTAYTPGPESCWPCDDGMTATLHSVQTNAGRLVAADTSVLPFGTLVSIDGYHAASVVPVLDRGGKIRGHRLDVLMETVEEARKWGVRRIPVVVWEYADGRGRQDPRRVR